VPQAVDHPVLIYDGDCQFCRRWVDRVKRYERADVIEPLPLQDSTAPGIAGLTRDQLLEAMCLALPDGGRFSGADAVREIMPFVRGGWFFRFAFMIPGSMPLSRGVYGWVARRRRTIGCGGDHCSIEVAAPKGRD
jgi:predicted DCC family thiol-disulfide oxidoreductase YuxK